MKKFLVIIATVLFHLFPIISICGQINDVSFRQISPPGGFVLKGIYTIAQDELGYIWMGTKQGLIRYDSENSSWFVPSKKDSLSIPDEEINDIYSGKNNSVWVATNKGLCVFDRQSQKFEQIEYTYEDGSKTSDSIYSILGTEDGRLFILDSRCAGYLDLKHQRMDRIGVGQVRRPTTIYKDNYNRIWIGTNAGEVYLFDSSKNDFKKIVPENGGRVNSIYADNDKIWVGFEVVGAKVFNFNGELLKQYVLNKSHEREKLYGTVRVIKKDTYGRLWIGAYEGLFMDDGKMLHSFEIDDYPELIHNSVYSIFEDRQGGLWIGTWSGGVALIHHSDNRFKTYVHDASKNSISNNTVSSFLQTGKKELLIGTEAGGLNSLDLTTDMFTQVKLSESQDVKNVKSLCKDKQGGIWVGTFKNGLWYKAPNSVKYKQFDIGPEDGSHISSPNVYSMCAVDSGVWMATFPLGINFYDFKTKSIRFCFQDSAQTRYNRNVISIFADSKSNLWIGTLRNLFKVHLPSNQITEIEDDNLSNNQGTNSIYYLWEHSSGDIWMGIKNIGILIYKPDINKFEAFAADGLLQGKDVYGIIEDKNKKIWITSNNGLILHDPIAKTNRHFVYSDGIQSNLFCPQAIYKDDRENLYFGGTNGFTRINPAEVRLNLKKPFTIINEIVTLDNKAIYPVYSDNLEIEKVYLKPMENTFRIRFSADNYLISEKNKYQYRLINYYDEWISNEHEGSVLFRTLGPANMFLR